MWAFALPSAWTTCASRRSAPARMSTGFVHSHSASMRIIATPCAATPHSLWPARRAMSRLNSRWIASAVTAATAGDGGGSGNDSAMN